MTDRRHTGLPRPVILIIALALVYALSSFSLTSGTDISRDPAAQQTDAGSDTMPVETESDEVQTTETETEPETEKAVSDTTEAESSEPETTEAEPVTYVAYYDESYFGDEDYTQYDWYPSDVSLKGSSRLIVVYKKNCVTVVFKKGDDRWIPERIMLCSIGRSTPTGTYKLDSDREPYHELFDSYGQYSTRVVKHILFHSVPIDHKAHKQSDGRMRMKLEEYEGLGTAVSMGCVRLLAVNAKWIYDNAKPSTQVIFTRSEGPEAPVPPPIIYEEPYIYSEDYGWDPTDPHPDNPYAAVYDTFD